MPTIAPTTAPATMPDLVESWLAWEEEEGSRGEGDGGRQLSETFPMAVPSIWAKVL
jgi:hypothetical protein